MISLTATGGAKSVDLLVFDGQGRQRSDLMGFASNTTVNVADFDSGAFLGWIASNGGTADDHYAANRMEIDALQVFKADAPCTVWIVRADGIFDLVIGQSGGHVTVSFAPLSDPLQMMLPPPLGEVRTEFTVPRGTAMAYEVAPGEIIQIIDVEGQQCSDFTALRATALERGIEREIDVTATRTMVRGAYPGPGLLDKFYDRDLNPMMRMVQDTCGRHDTFGMACTARGYEDRGFPGHVNCSDNISHAFDPYGIAGRPA
ncbi:MAG: urea carboxylase-associated family protein, partial [Pseudomonadota bacterium]